jgi:monofunctional biosynthetic peptidoglycan transglycosylase
MKIVKNIVGFFIKLVLLFVLLSVALVITLKWINPPVTALIVQTEIKARLAGYERATIHYQWVGYDDISPYVLLAVVASEDQKFPFHSGFDFEAIEAALKHNERSKRLRGASTISQQVAKNLFLWPQRSWPRKGLEAYFTFLIEAIWSKRRILEMYVNIVQMGGNVFGVSAASTEFFDKPASALSAEEAALLAAVLPGPAKYRVDKPSGYVIKRRDWILRQMRALGGPDYLGQL